MLQECSSWASRNYAVQIYIYIYIYIYILMPNINMLAGKFIKWERFLAMFWEYIIFNLKCVEVCKLSEIFWVKLYCKMSDLFLLVFVGLRLSTKKIWNKKTNDFHWNVWTNIKMLFPRNNNFKKSFKWQITRFWIIYILAQILWFGGLF